MSRQRRKSSERKQDREFLAFENVSLRWGEKLVFKDTNWTWRAGEHWAFLGLDGSGTSLLIEAIQGRAPPIQGEVRGPCPGPGPEERFIAPATAHVSPQTQRDVAVRESSFYQLRWHSGLEQGSGTVGQFLSQGSVEEHNPFEIDPCREQPETFLRRRRQFIRRLKIGPLLRRRLVHLSNGELRKVLLIQALLKSPRLLILEEPYAGLDAKTRRKLATVISQYTRGGGKVLVATHRAEGIPAGATHLLLVENHRVIAQGPKKQVVDIWRKRSGATPSPPGRSPRRGPRRPAKRTDAGKLLVEFRHVTVFGAGRTILHDIVWTLREGECWLLLGPNGAGKSAMLNLIQGDHPQVYSQDIRLFGGRTESTQTLWRARQHIGWMSPELHQHYPAGWDIEDVVCSGFTHTLGLHQPSSRRHRAAAREWLIQLGFARRAHVPFGELPFGRQRLVLLARAVVRQPRLLVLDEPCQGLDTTERRILLHAVEGVITQTGVSLIFVTHREHEVPNCITHLLRLSSGRVCESRRVSRADSISGETYRD